MERIDFYVSSATPEAPALLTWVSFHSHASSWSWRASNTWVEEQKSPSADEWELSDTSKRHSKPYFSQTQWAGGSTCRTDLPQTLMCRLQWKSSSDRDLIEEMSVLWLSCKVLWNNVCSSSISQFSSCGRLTTDDRSSSPDLQLKANASCCTHMHLC